MINTILKGITTFVMSIALNLLGPIDGYIDSHFPAITSGLNAVNTLFDYVLDFIGYAIDMSGLSSVAITLIVGYLVFSFGITLGTYIVKLIIKWWHMLVP